MKNKQIVLLEEHYRDVLRLTLDRPGLEGAAFILCGQGATESVDKLISHLVVAISPEDYLRRSRDGLSIHSQAFARITKLARSKCLSIVFVHSHPTGMAHFSIQDDQEERKLMPFLFNRVPGRIHGTMVVTETTIAARVYSGSESVDTRAAVLTVGNRIRIYGDDTHSMPSLAFDRQVRAFGSEVQHVLGALHVGIVGLGGTGSAVAEQLYRLGIGRLTLFDGDTLDETNINRVFGSTVKDIGQPKAILAKRHLDRIGLKAAVTCVSRHITNESTARQLVDCDVVFGCTDKQLPRAILIQLALRYCLPVFDLGVLIDSYRGLIRGVVARVTTLLPGEACLLCRGRISVEGLRVEGLSREERSSQVRAGYAPELEGPAPAVISFTSATASFGVSEFLHRLTGFMGADRESSEILAFLDQLLVRRNRVAAGGSCLCSTRDEWGLGDASPFLGMAWPIEPT